jgi:two-component system LytT family sensor kinase
MVGGWTAFGTVQALGMLVFPNTTAWLFWHFFLPINLLMAWWLTLLTPAVVWLTRWTARADRPTRVAALVHGPAAIAIAIGYGVTRARLSHVIYPKSDWGWVLITIMWVDLNLLYYAAVAVVTRAVDQRRAYGDRLRRRFALETELARAQLQFLQRQVQPHFLFNCLNAITELAHESPAAARGVVSQLQSLLRTAAATDGRYEITLGEEIGALAPYVEIQRVRFGEWLTVDWEIDPAAMPALMPPFVLQPLVENAIRHGLAVRRGPGRVVVRATVANGALCLSVRDTGVGLAAAQHHTNRRGIGIRNVRERLQSLYGRESRLVLRDAERGGAEADVRIPYHRTPIASTSGGTALNGNGSGDPAPPLAPSSPRLSARAWGAIIAIWIALGLMWIVEPYFQAEAIGEPNPMWAVRSLAAANSISMVVWVVMMPAVLAVARWIRAHVARVWQRVLLHAVGAVTCAGAQIALLAGLHLLPPAMPWWTQQALIIWDLVAYAAIVAWWTARDFLAWSREHETDGLRLEAAIAQARWRMLRVHLRPELVCASLDRVAGLVERDVAGAERATTELGDFLRERLHALP